MKKYDEIVKKLISEYGTGKCELNFGSRYELLIAVILSSQCTDKRVNKVTESLFKIANTPEKMLALGEDKLKECIKSCGFYNNKSKNIIKASRDILDRFGGEVPDNFDDLCSLGGVGEKTANVVLAVGFNIPAFAVDTHVFRVSNRLGMVKTSTAHQTTIELKKKISKEFWIDGHYALVLHGRYCCKARKPECERCLIKDMCKAYSSR